jgi:hypothetical protein
VDKNGSVEMHFCLNIGVNIKIGFAFNFHNTDIFLSTHPFFNTGASSFIGMINSRMMKWEDNIKMDLPKKGRNMWAGFFLFRIGTSGGLLRSQ